MKRALYVANYVANYMANYVVYYVVFYVLLYMLSAIKIISRFRIMLTILYAWAVGLLGNHQNVAFTTMPEKTKNCSIFLSFSFKPCILLYLCFYYIDVR